LFFWYAAVAKAGAGSEKAIGGTNFSAFFRDLGHDSSDSQAVEKFRNDRPKVWGIIKE
jgi:hypothetical protein